VDFSLLEMWHRMGLPAKAVMALLAGMSAWSLGLTIERLASYAAARARSLRFVGELSRLLRARDLDGAIARARVRPQPPVARVVAAALEEYAECREERAIDAVAAVERTLARVREREAAELRRGLGALGTIGSAAPFIGLFGTVLGIIDAFRSMAQPGPEAAAATGLAVVAGGISEALVTTAFGLFVAIPAVVAFNACTTRVEALLVDVDDVASEVAGWVAKDRARSGG